MTRHWLWLLLAASAALASADEVETRTSRKLEGKVVGIDARGALTLQQGERTRRLLVSGLRSAVFSGSKPSASDAPHLLSLVDGTRLEVELVSAGGGRLTLRWRGQEYSVALAQVRALSFSTGAMTQAGRLPRPYAVVDGKTVEVDPAKLAIDGEHLTVGETKHPREKLSALHLPGSKASSGAGTSTAYARVMLSESDMLVGLIRSLDDKSLVLATSALGRVTLPRERVWRLVWGGAGGLSAGGLTLVASSHGRRVAMIGPSGAVLWEVKPLAKPHDVELLPDGTLLVCEYEGGRVLRMTVKGEIKWKLLDLRQPIDVDALPSGNVLVTEFAGQRIVELNKKGDVVWSYAAVKSPNEADPVGDDKILITDSGNKRVILIDKHKGKILWQHTGLLWPMDADMLPNGNVLITDNNASKVIEVDRKGRVVWEFSCRNPYEADRLPNGNTLIVETDRRRVIEVTPEKEIVWEAKGLNYPVAATRH